VAGTATSAAGDLCLATMTMTGRLRHSGLLVAAREAFPTSGIEFVQGARRDGASNMETLAAVAPLSHNLTGRSTAGSGAQTRIGRRHLRRWRQPPEAIDPTGAHLDGDQHRPALH
jgi:hypothetical protein